MIKGIHHVALKAESMEKYEAAKRFYIEVLGLKLLREWPTGCMLDTGGGIIELFNNAPEALPQGAIRHFAFYVDDVDAAAESVRAAGCTITTEPDDRLLKSEPPLPIRICFFIGPLGEEIEFFHIREE